MVAPRNPMPPAVNKRNDGDARPCSVTSPSGVESLFTRSLWVYPAVVGSVVKESVMVRIRVNTGGGRPAKDRMFERRVAEEAARPSPVVGPPALMGFGKFKETSVTEVDAGYLLWCQENMDHCPLYIIGELRRRGYGDHNLSGSAFLTKKQQARERKKAKSRIKSEKQRRLSLELHENLKSGMTTVGSEYQRLRDEFDRANGDPDECPFDTNDHKYTGPTICWVGGKPVVVPSEFCKEVQ